MAKFYITTPIFYVNAPPHLGHAYADVVADILARWHRARGEETFFLSGTDEHGAKIARAAEVAGQKPEEFVASRRADFQDLLQKLHASNDDFIYTTDQDRHWPGVEKIWRKLADNEDLYKAAYKGLYCVGHEAFVTEKDLEGGVCKDHNQKPEVIEEENYFFRLSKYVPRVREAIEKDEFQILPVSRKKEVLAFLTESVTDISFSRPRRDIAWGIQVPLDVEHTIYVWADALTNYMSVLGYGSADESKFQKFWPADVHVIGKDILRFHAVYWPAMLLAADLPLPRTLLVTGMIRSGGHKMSKTLGNVVDPKEMIKEYGVDAFRYFLAREIPVGEDGDFTLERFREVYEGALAHGLGNLASRTAAMIQKYFAGTIERPEEAERTSVPTRRELHKEVSAERVSLSSESLERYFAREVVSIFDNAMVAYKITDAISTLQAFWSLLDGYIQDYEPYKLAKTDSEKTKVVLWNVAWHIARSAVLLEPFMPDTSAALLKLFGVSRAEAENPERIVIAESGALFPSKEDKK